MNQQKLLIQKAQELELMEEQSGVQLVYAAS